jgi:hypothetical protein
MSINRDELSHEEKYFLLELSYLNLPNNYKYETRNPSIDTILNHLLTNNELTQEEVGKVETLYTQFTKLSTTNPGLQDIKIVGYENHNPVGNTTHDTKTGFVGYAMEDSNGNRGFLFRGSEMGWSDKLMVDMGDNVTSSMTGTSKQVEQAKEFFDTYKAEGQTNSLYGHSKGNNLAGEVYVDNLELDIYAYGVNGQPVYWFDKTKEQKEALRGDNYDFIIHERDIVNGLGYVDYVDTVVHLRDGVNRYTFAPHSLDTVDFDPDGNFVSTMESDIVKRQLYTNAGALRAHVLQQLSHQRLTTLFSDPLGIEIFKQVSKSTYYYLVDTVKILMKSAVDNTLSFAQTVKNKVVDAVAKVEKLAEKAKNQVSTWLNRVTETSLSIFQKITKGAAGFFGGGAGASYDFSQIQITIPEIRRIAARLASIQQRVNSVDARLNSLIGLVDLDQKLTAWNIARQIDKNDLQGCIQALNQIASGFEQCESKIRQKAQSL